MYGIYVAAYNRISKWNTQRPFVKFTLIFSCHLLFYAILIDPGKQSMRTQITTNLIIHELRQFFLERYNSHLLADMNVLIVRPNSPTVDSCIFSDSTK